MIGSLLIAIIATAFFYAGNNFFQNKGFFLAVVCVLTSFVGLSFIPPGGLIGLLIANVVLGLIVLAVKFLHKPKPRP